MGILHLPRRACFRGLRGRSGPRESERLPPLERTELMGLPLPVFAKSPHAHFPAAILLYLRRRMA